MAARWPTLAASRGPGWAAQVNLLNTGRDLICFRGNTVVRQLDDGEGPGPGHFCGVVATLAAQRGGRMAPDGGQMTAAGLDPVEESPSSMEQGAG